MEFQVGEQFPLGLRKLLFGPADELCAQPAGGSPQRIALLSGILHLDKTFLDQGAQRGRRILYLLLNVGSRQRTAVQQFQNQTRRIVRIACHQVELTGGIASGGRKQENLTMPHLAGKRPYGSQSFAEGRTVVIGNPAGQLHQAVSKTGSSSSSLRTS